MTPLRTATALLPRTTSAAGRRARTTLPEAGRKALLLLVLASTLSLLFAPAPARGAEARAGKAIFERSGCGRCHGVEGPERRLPVPERHRIKGPTLWYAGSKFRPGFLAGWLEKPRPFRGVLFGTMKRGRYAHPALTKEEAREVAVWLESLKDPQMPAGVVPRWKKIPRRTLRRARILFQKKQPCYSCHMVSIRKTVYRAKIEVGGHSAPHFRDAGRRLNPDFIVAFLKNPGRYNPNGRMPVYGDKAFTRLSEADFIALAAYIASFK